VAVCAGVVTFENGDLFDIAANPGDTVKVTALPAADTLQQLRDHEPAIVSAFSTIVQGERNRRTDGLSAAVICWR
jgi:hypothetical protein